MSKNSNQSSGGIGVCGLLGVVFVTLKLCGVINWSWWWVTCPFWAPLIIILVIVGIIVAIGVAAAILAASIKSVN